MSCAMNKEVALQPNGQSLISTFPLEHKTSADASW